MKPYLLLGLALLASCAAKQETTPAEEKAPTARLTEVLQAAVDSGKYIFGHADDTAYGRSWEYEEGRSDVKEIVGDYPGLINWDLGHLELDSAVNLDGVPFEYMAAEIAKQDARGGINSISWHLNNPVTFDSSWDVSNPETMKLITTEGTEANARMKEWIGKTADFIGSLKDANGDRIPVLWRPWHEHTGSWFWWGKDHSTTEQYKELWKMTRKVFDEKGIDNVLWVYSPDKAYSEEEYLERYPGDEYIDVMGTDIYHFDSPTGEEDFRANVKQGLDVAAKVAKGHGKLLAFTETGLDFLPIADWFTRVLMPAIDGYPITYVCVWRNAQTWMKEQYFAPYPGHPSAEDFKIFYQSPKTLFAKDVKTLVETNEPTK